MAYAGRPGLGTVPRVQAAGGLVEPGDDLGDTARLLRLPVELLFDGDLDR